MRGIYLSQLRPLGRQRARGPLMEKLTAGSRRRSRSSAPTGAISNLDDMHENGIHDYLKFVKFGYGRGTDHACKDIRAGRMTREQGIEMVRKYDHVKSARPRALARLRRT